MNEEQIYFDNNVYRPITRESSCWLSFKEAVDGVLPGLLDRSSAIFTWGQALEICNLGRIMGEIEKSQIWKASIEGKKLLDQQAYEGGLNLYFETACKAIASLPKLQKKELLSSFDVAIQHTCKEAQSVVDDTLGRYRAVVAADNYMNDLSRELAWAFLTSYPFAKSKRQWKNRKIYYDCLIALWLTLFSEGHDLVFFRLAERQFEASLKYSEELELDKVKNSLPNLATRQDLLSQIFKADPHKATSDLCDCELIHFAYLGSTLGSSRKPVVGFTQDAPATVQQRMASLDRVLKNLKEEVDGWNVLSALGRVLTVDVSQGSAVINEIIYPCNRE